MESSNQIKLVERKTIVVNRLQLSQDFIHPENVRLQLDKKVRVNPIDLGALAYIVRQPQKNNNLAHLPWLVAEDSFMQSRRKLLVKLHDAIFTTGNSETTIRNHLNAYVEFISWFDTHGHCGAFETEGSARDAYIAFVAELNHQIKSVGLNNIIPITANGKQRALITLLGLYWGIEATQEIISEIPIIKFKRGDGEAPEEAKLRFATKTFLHLAKGFKEFVMKNKEFPYLLKMPGYECYVFPSNVSSCVTPYTTTEVFSYHYQEGRISTPKEYMMKCPRKVSEKEAKRDMECVQNNFIEANSDPRNMIRLNYASLAMKSYMQLFVLMTGVNPSELIQLEYDDNIFLEKDLLKNDFRAIKMRAAGREVAYHLGNRKGMALFKEYIELRNWVLAGADCPYLFFLMGGSMGNFSQHNDASVYRVYKSVKSKFFPKSFANITAGKVRKYKTAVWNEIGVAQEVIAEGLNHELGTNHKYYAVSNPDKQQAEFGLFFEATKAAVKIITERAKATERIPVKVIADSDGQSTTKIGTGHCDDFQHPEAMEDDPPIAPDCNSQMGCLYCEHYVCHSDAEDIKKLYSLLYVIEAVREMAIDFNHSDKLLLELTVRIQLVLTQMSAKSEDIKTMVESIKEDVMEHGLLTPFWEFRLERYEAMGVVV